MKKYTVNIEVVNTYCVDVEAENEDEAEELALDMDCKDMFELGATAEVVHVEEIEEKHENANPDMRR